MKKIGQLLAILFLGLILIYSCSKNKDEVETTGTPVKTDEIPLGLIEKSASSGQNATARTPDPEIVACRDKYSVVVRDADGWEIMLNEVRRRKITYSTDSLISYAGHLMYKSGASIIKGKASAIYDQRNQAMLVCALDSAYSLKKINYNIQFTDNETTMNGSYIYYEKPTQMNSVGCELIKGRIDANIRKE